MLAETIIHLSVGERGGLLNIFKAFKRLTSPELAPFKLTSL